MRPSLRVAAGRFNDRPFVLYAPDGRLSGGLAKDIMDALARDLGAHAVYLDLPRARVETSLAAGQVDAACFLAPAWSSMPAKLRWSPPLFHVRQAIVSPATARPVNGPRDLFGRRLGTLRNFVYPELNAHFSAGRILRSDASSNLDNLAKLQRDRIDAFVDVDLSILYTIHRGAPPIPLRVDPLWAPPNPVHCAFSPAFAKAYPQINALLAAAIDDGRMAHWIAHYTGGRHISTATPPSVDSAEPAPADETPD